MFHCVDSNQTARCGISRPDNHPAHCATVTIVNGFIPNLIFCRLSETGWGYALPLCVGKGHLAMWHAPDSRAADQRRSIHRCCFIFSGFPVPGVGRRKLLRPTPGITATSWRLVHAPPFAPLLFIGYTSATNFSLPVKRPKWSGVPRPVYDSYFIHKDSLSTFSCSCYHTRVVTMKSASCCLFISNWHHQVASVILLFCARF